MTDYFQYSEKEIEHLKKTDKRLAYVIEKIGMIERAVNPDLFSALVNCIIGQQISTKAHQTIWERMKKELGEITPVVIDSLMLEKLQQFGITFRKAGYIKSVAQKILTNEFDINSLHTMPDEKVCAKLSELNGIE
jgi:DNA-3-methyladenine glycosylase II